MKNSLVRAFVCILLISSTRSLYAANGTWIGGGADGNWTTTANWFNGIVGGVTSGTTTSATVLFNNATTTNVTVDSGRALKAMTFDTGAGAYTLSGGSFVLSSNFTVTINAGVTNSQIINTPITMVLNGLFTNNSTTAGVALTIGGNITGVASGTSLLTVEGTGNGTISGVIADGAAGQVNLSKVQTGTWTLSGSNTYSGKTSIVNSLIVSSLNSVGAGHVASSSLGAPTTVANGTIDLGSTSGNTGKLIYIGTGETTDRVINLVGTGTGGTIENDGSGALAFSSAISSTSTSVVTLTLRGSNTGNNEMQGAIGNSATGTTNLVKADAGTWILSGSNTYAGTTTVSAGTLLINGNHTGAGAYSVSGGTLGGNGSITTASNASIIVASGGRLSPSGNAFTMTLGTGSLNISGAVNGAASQSLLFDLNSTSNSDKITLTTGSLNIGSGVLNFDDFVFTTGTGFGAGTYTLFATPNMITGLGTDLTGMVGGLNASLQLLDGGTDLGLVVTAAPEASTLGTLALGCMALGFAQYVRRRKRA